MRGRDTMLPPVSGRVVSFAWCQFREGCSEYLVAAYPVKNQECQHLPVKTNQSLVSLKSNLPGELPSSFTLLVSIALQVFLDMPVIN